MLPREGQVDMLRGGDCGCHGNGSHDVAAAAAAALGTDGIRGTRSRWERC